MIHNNPNPVQAAQPTDKPDTGPSQVLLGIQVLLVEDEPDIAELLSFILEGFGAAVTEVHSAEAALDSLTERQPDILICNIKLPDHDGSWLLEQVRRQESEQQGQLPAIAVTSYTREVSQAHALSAGFQQFMQKPLDPYLLIAEVLALTEATEAADSPNEGFAGT